MAKKIVIVGALGYLGTELCKLYSGESWFHNIIAIDSRFVSKRINQLKDWNIKFYQGGILDKNFLNKHLKDADVVHHLAGITDVAYVKKESNSDQDENIKKIEKQVTARSSLILMISSIFIDLISYKISIPLLLIM